MKKGLLIFAGMTSLSLGVVGIVLPVLPTTPFLLLSACCFLRSSQSLYDWITHHRLFGRYISLYLKYHGMTSNSKRVSITFLWIFISISIIVMDILWLRLLLIIIALGVTLHLLLMTTITKEMLNEEDISPI